MERKECGGARKKGIYEAYVKRPADFVLAFIMLVILAPLTAAVWVLVKVKLGSPVIFRQKRPGLDEKIFTMYKFRTMTEAKDRDGRLMADEERLTKFGKILRETSCDELLELVNILKGDLSWCGPRPQLVRDMVFMSERQRMRHRVRPGLTGLAQVNGRNSISWEEKLEWDLKYIEDGITFMGDVKILLRTVGKVIKKADICGEGMATAEDYGDYLLRTGKVGKEEYDRLQVWAEELVKKEHKKQHILILNHYAGSPELGMEYRPYYLGQEWLKLGYRVTVIAASYSHIRRTNRTQKKFTETENIDGIRYIWIRTGAYRGNGAGRIINMIQYICGLYRLQNVFRDDMICAVIASSTYPLDNYPACRIAEKAGAKYMYEVHDLWPLSPRELGDYSRYHPFIAIMQLAENFAYKHADEVISILLCALPHMERHGLQKQKFTHIPNGICVSEAEKPEPLSEEVKAAIPEGRFLVGYCGTLGKANAVNKLIETARLTQKGFPDIFYVIVGEGTEKERLRRLSAEYHLNNVQILDGIPKRQVQSFLKICHVIAIIWNDTPLYRYGISPNKLFDYMYSQRPVIQAVKAGNDILRDSGCGITCEASPEAIREAVLKLRALSETDREKMGRRGRQYVLEYHEYSKLAKEFIKVIER